MGPIHISSEEGSSERCVDFGDFIRKLILSEQRIGLATTGTWVAADPPLPPVRHATGSGFRRILANLAGDVRGPRWQTRIAWGRGAPFLVELLG